MLFDLHCHTSLKAANSAGVSGTIPDTDVWNERSKQGYNAADLIKESLLFTSQSHMNALTEGQVWVVCNCLYALERQFTMPEEWTGWVNDKVAKLTGFDRKRISEISKRTYTYFQETEREYNMLLNNRQHTTFAKYGNKYILVNSYDEIIDAQKQASKTICLVNTIEGLHCLAKDFYTNKGEYIDIKKEQRKNSEVYKSFVKATCENIDACKKWEYPPFFITLSHHFYNYFFGHAFSIPGIQNGAAWLPNGSSISYFYLGIKTYGMPVLQKLLSRVDAEGKPVRRILPDCKHLNPQGRLDYYELIKFHKKSNDLIPVIHSHTAVSGRKSLKRSIDHAYKILPDEIHPFYNQGHINLYDEDITETVESDGIMGFMLDDKRIIGKDLPPECGMSNKEFQEKRKAIALLYNECNKQERVITHPNSSPEEKDKARIVLEAFRKRIEEDRKPLVLVYGAVILRQFFRVAELCGEKGWNHVCFGTDYDGVINPADIYAQADKLSLLPNDLKVAWNHFRKVMPKPYETLLFGNTPEYFIEKACYSNGANFLKKYFNDKYLKEGNMGVSGTDSQPLLS